MKAKATLLLFAKAAATPPLFLNVYHKLKNRQELK